MTAFRQWLLGIGICAVLVGSVRSVLPQGRTGAVVQFVSGLLLLLCVLKPLGQIQWDELLSDTDWREERTVQQEQLQKTYDEMLQTSIAGRTEAYIEDKASALGLAVDVTVSGAEDGTISVEIVGDRNAALERYMTEELGITHERQKWRDGS